ncbi:MAG: hypothetical protein MO847_07605 [Candidatus Protistobacter heckmanni]|nr:hypothetical protein [Candidatus Protistobacter heckmanni]
MFTAALSASAICAPGAVETFFTPRLSGAIEVDLSAALPALFSVRRLSSLTSAAFRSSSARLKTLAAPS